MFQDFCVSSLMIFLAELGDKTQLVALTLATRYNTRVVLAGIFVATLLVHVFSAALGNLAGDLLPTHWIQYLAGIAFVGFGLWTLRGDCLDGDDCGHQSRISPFSYCRNGLLHRRAWRQDNVEHGNSRNQVRFHTRLAGFNSGHGEL
jgi:putative Ca2+/H+ antiporter (TMEM165/GDT1 family)